MKRSPLKQNAASTRAWRERSQRAAQVKRAAEAKGRVEGKTLTMADALAVPFKAKRPARTQKCAVCGQTARVWHHWTPQQALRRWARTYVRDEGLRPETARMVLRDVLRNEANMTPLCRVHHSAGDPLLGGGFRRKDVPASARVFAAQLGPEYVARLERMYP